MLIVDLRPGPAEMKVLDDLAIRGVRVLHNGANRGLSYSRNLALAHCTNRHLLYVDDDVVVAGETIEAIRRSVSEGAGVVGAWLTPTFTSAVPWWLTGGQYHYLGVHHAVEQARTWGACMAVDTALARQAGLTFREDLGRRGNSLQSGEDTTFLAEMRAAGATERFLTDAVAFHHVTPGRTRLSYLVRRAWWQGRSEVRRSTGRSSLKKEWQRGVALGAAAAPGAGRRYLLSLMFSTVVLSGIATESVFRVLGRGRGQ